MLSKDIMKTSRGVVIHVLPPNDEYHHYDAWYKNMSLLVKAGVHNENRNNQITVTIIYQ